MLNEPGNLSDFGPDAQRTWHEYIVKLVTDYTAQSNSKHFRLAGGNDWETGVSVVDWDGFPKILQNCLGDEKSSRFCDWQTPLGDLGRAYAQDEYFEWRTVRDINGKLLRFEATTELAKYWEILAAYHPVTTLRILGRFAGEAVANWREVYGSLNPHDSSTTPKQRANSFNEMMVWSRRSNTPVKSPYNNGQKAIAFLSKPVSSLNAAIALFVYAGTPYGKVVSGQEVRMSGPEAIASTPQAAIDCRNSDPSMVGLMNALVWEGREVAFNDPIGVYIRGFAAANLLTPDGNPIPEDWVEFQRGSRPRNGTGEERSQRLVVEVPPGVGFDLGDLVSSDTGENISTGYQLAELVKVACYFSRSKIGKVLNSRVISNVSTLADCASAQNCSDWQARYRDFEASQIAPEVVDIAMMRGPVQST